MLTRPRCGSCLPLPPKTRAGKTETFSVRIEALQKDLQPWAAKIADKQAAIDLAANERDLFAEKGESVKLAIEQAQATVQKLAVDDESKVRERFCLLALALAFTQELTWGRRSRAE